MHKMISKLKPATLHNTPTSNTQYKYIQKWLHLCRQRRQCVTVIKWIKLKEETFCCYSLFPYTLTHLFMNTVLKLFKIYDGTKMALT